MIRQLFSIDSNKAPEASLSSASISTSSNITSRSSVERSREIYSLKDNDVLSGRGSIINKHVGNRRFRRMITANRQAYARCEKNSHKFFLALSIVVAIGRKGGRFLKKRDEKIDDSCFVEISRKESVAKTTQALRDQLQGTPIRRRRSSASSVERMVRNKKRTHWNREQREIDGYSRGCDAACSDEDDDDNTSSDDTSLDSHEVLPIHRAAQPFNGFAELLAASSTMNPQPRVAVPSSFTSDQQSALRRHFYHQSRGGVSLGTPVLFGAERPSYSTGAFGSTSNAPAPSRAEKIWVPQELEILMLSDPDAAEALAHL